MLQPATAVLATDRRGEKDWDRHSSQRPHHHVAARPDAPTQDHSGLSYDDDSVNEFGAQSWLPELRRPWADIWYPGGAPQFYIDMQRTSLQVQMDGEGEGDVQRATPDGRFNNSLRYSTTQNFLDQREAFCTQTPMNCPLIFPPLPHHTLRSSSTSNDSSRDRPLRKYLQLQPTLQFLNPAPPCDEPASLPSVGASCCTTWPDTKDAASFYRDQYDSREYFTRPPPTEEAYGLLQSPIMPPPYVLAWPVNDSSAEAYPANSENPVPGATPIPVPKRKHESCSPAPSPQAKRGRKAPAEAEGSLADFVVVFENAPGALATVKRRRKLDAPVRKAAKAVRKAGACHQCRFRKRTCSTGTPCNSCLRNGNGLHELKCQRESPFLGQGMHHYFAYSSKKRIVAFNLMVSPVSTLNFQQVEVIIDGIGRVSYPLKLPAWSKTLNGFQPEDKKVILTTLRSESKNNAQGKSNPVVILEENNDLGRRVEQWAMEYTSKMVASASPRFRATTTAMTLSIAYVKKNLPESPLIASMVRVSSLAFVLRAGVTCNITSTASQVTTPFRTIQASIDTILYHRLALAERDLCNLLQKIVFRNAGSLTKEQVYPVALVFWQLLRYMCLSASHLTNLHERFGESACGTFEEETQYHALRLLLSTHMALFRSSCPLVWQFGDGADSFANRGKTKTTKESTVKVSEKVTMNADLLGNDAEMCKLANTMAEVVKKFREKGFPDLKGSLTYRKAYFDLFRKVYDKM